MILMKVVKLVKLVKLVNPVHLMRNNLNIFLFQDFELHVVDTAGQDEYSIFPTQYAVDIHGWEK